MYIKVSKKSQMIILRKLNPFLENYRIPKRVLHEMGNIIRFECHRKKDYIALFLKPVENDTTEILDALQVYPVKAEFVDDNLYTIAVKKKKGIIWSYSEIKVESENQRIFAFYPMRDKDMDKRGGC